MGDKRLVFGNYTLRYEAESNRGPAGWHVLDNADDQVTWTETYEDAVGETMRMGRGDSIGSLVLDISGCLDDLEGTDSVEVLVRLQAALAVLRS